MEITNKTYTSIWTNLGNLDSGLSLKSHGKPYQQHPTVPPLTFKEVFNNKTERVKVPQ